MRLVPWQLPSPDVKQTKPTRRQKRARTAGKRRSHDKPRRTTPAKRRVPTVEPVSLSNTPEEFRDVLRYIERQLSVDLSLRELADLAGQPILRFARRFRETTGLTLWQYVRLRRTDPTKRHRHLAPFTVPLPWVYGPAASR
jgi:AraC-like DNA-binding protein